jgi:hypothetical protein
MKCGLVTWNPKPKSIHGVGTPNFQQYHQYEESWQLSPETVKFAAYGFA